MVDKKISKRDERTFERMRKLEARAAAIMEAAWEKVNDLEEKWDKCEDAIDIEKLRALRKKANLSTWYEWRDALA